jgi:hypothetical protein
VGLRYREPVYRTTRELVMSYFEAFFNSFGEKTLRGYTRPIRLSRFDHLNWELEDQAVDLIEEYLKNLKYTHILTPEMEAGLSKVDQRFYDGMTVGTDPDGVYKIG